MFFDPPYCQFCSTGRTADRTSRENGNCANESALDFLQTEVNCDRTEMFLYFLMSTKNKEVNEFHLKISLNATPSFGMMCENDADET